MYHQRILAKRQVTRQLKTTEHAIDEAGIALGELLISGLKARRSAGLSITVGDQQVAGIISTLIGWQGMRQSVISTHHGLYDLDGQLGTRISSDSGDLGDKIGVDHPEASTNIHVIPLAA